MSAGAEALNSMDDVVLAIISLIDMDLLGVHNHHSVHSWACLQHLPASISLTTPTRTVPGATHNLDKIPII